jgi:hypothetical protein
VSGQLHAPAALPPEKEVPVPIGLEAGLTQSRSGQRGEDKILELKGLELRPPVASRHTDYAIPAPSFICVYVLIL